MEKRKRKVKRVKRKEKMEKRKEKREKRKWRRENGKEKREKSKEERENGKEKNGEEKRESGKEKRENVKKKKKEGERDELLRVRKFGVAKIVEGREMAGGIRGEERRGENTAVMNITFSRCLIFRSHLPTFLIHDFLFSYLY